MTKPIRVDAEAEEEIAHAITHYENERDGLGAEFWGELSVALQTLEAPGPECGSVIGLPRDLGVRRKLLTRFPYAIIFVEGETFVRVISVMHGPPPTGVLEPPLVNESFPSFLDEDLDSGNDSMPQAFEFPRRI